MRRRDDDLSMVDQAWADRLLSGEPLDDDGGLSGVVAAVRATAECPAPPPSAALAVILREGLVPGPDLAPASRRPLAVRRWSARTVRVAAASAAATLAMGAGVATAEIRGVSTLDYIPEPVRRGVDAAVSAVADVFTRNSDSDSEPGQDLAPTGPAQAPASPSPGPSGVPSEAPAPSVAPSPPAPSADPTRVPTPTPTPTPSDLPSLQPSPPVSPEPPASPAPSEVPPSLEPSPSDGSAEPEQKPLGNDPSPSPSPSDDPSEGEPEGVSDEPSGESGSRPSPSPSSGRPSDRPDGPRRSGKAEPAQAVPLEPSPAIAQSDAAPAAAPDRPA